MMKCFWETIFDLLMLKETSQITIYIFISFSNFIGLNNHLRICLSTQFNIFQNSGNITKMIWMESTLKIMNLEI